MKHPIRPLLLALALMAALATPAMAHVHGISNAQCAPAGVASGAQQSAHAIGDPGRPAAPIPRTASGKSAAEWTGQGGTFDAQGTFCGPNQ